MRTRRHVFVLRIWAEEEQGTDDLVPISVLRGSIQSVESQQVYYFTSLHQAMDLLKGMLGDEDWVIR